MLRVAASEMTYGSILVYGEARPVGHPTRRRLHMDYNDNKKYPLPEDTFLGMEYEFWGLMSLTLFVSTALFLFFV